MSMHGSVDAVRRVGGAIVRAAGLCVLLLAPALLQAGEAAVPQPDDGRVTVIVILSESPAGGQAGRLDLEAYGAKLERRRHPQWIITLPEASLERLAADPGVKFLQRVYTGEPLPPMPARPAGEGPRQQVDSTGVSWQSGDYRYDGAGNITQIGGTQQFQYDKAGRLTQASVNGATEAYAYDSFGNLTQTSGTLRSVPTSTAADKATNRLTGVPYDSAGNVRQLDGADLVYDGFNMLRARIASDGTQTTYVYTADDERIGIEGPAGSRWMIRDLGGKVLREWDAAQDIWQWEEDYIYGGGQLVAAEREPAEGGTRHFHLDHLGTPRLITNANGLKVAAHDYFAFGSEITDFRQEMTAGTAPRPEPMKFTGHERDFVGGTATNNQNSIDYMHARYYTPVRGRFLSVDPSRDSAKPSHPQSWNRYSYAANNPVRYTDPDGRVTFDTVETEANYAVARRYLVRSRTGANLIERFERLSGLNEPHIMANASRPKGGGSHFRRRTNTIVWNVQQAAVASGAGVTASPSGSRVISPAMLLVHEIAHAVRFNENPTAYNQDRQPSATGTNREEERATNVENRIGLEINEATRGKYSNGEGTIVHEDLSDLLERRLREEPPPQ